MSYNEKSCRKLIKNFNLICNIIDQKNASNTFTVDLSKLEDIISKKIPDSLKKCAPEDFYEVYSDFKAVYDKFKDFILYDKLIGKNIVSLGGGFSSGKSSFLNYIMDTEILPSSIDPSTSVPTYIISSEDTEITGVNIFDVKVNIRPSDIKKIAHGFGKIEGFDNGELFGDVTLGHILKSIFISTELNNYENIAFLDTPGYSKPDSEKHCIKTDEEIARVQLNSSNYILWFVQADAGTISERDIEFLKTVKADIPKLIILNKADKKNLNELRQIINKTNETLVLKGIKYVDVLAFSSMPEQIWDSELKEFLESDTKRIRHYLEKCNRRIDKADFAYSFKQLFLRCKEFYEEELEEKRRDLSYLNDTLIRGSAENISSDIFAPVEKMVSLTKKEISLMQSMLGVLDSLKEEFFEELKSVSDIVHISLPEPDEIDLIKDNAVCLLSVIKEYKKERAIKNERFYLQILKDIFDDAHPVLGYFQGSDAYSDEMFDILADNYIVSDGHMKINLSPGGIYYPEEIFETLDKNVNVDIEEVFINKILSDAKKEV